MWEQAQEKPICPEWVIIIYLFSSYFCFEVSFVLRLSHSVFQAGLKLVVILGQAPSAGIIGMSQRTSMSWYLLIGGIK